MRLIRTSRVMAASAALVLSLGLAACGDDGEPTASDPEPTAETSPSEEPTEEPTEEPSKHAQVDDADLPGDAMDGMPPLEGDEVAVVGVEVGDVLNVRALPDPESDGVDELEPVAEGLAATGRNRMVDSGIWAEIETDAGFGWANMTYLAYLGEAEDRTGDVDAGPAGSTKDLAEAVAEQLDGGDVTVIAEEGNQIVADALVSEDDSVRGSRLTITTAADGDEFTAESVLVAPLCARGVADEGLCL